MKTTLTLGLAALVLTGGVAAAMAADGPRGDRGMRGADFETLDRTGDGILNADDFAAAAEARFAEFDTDGNGEVTEEEFIARAEARAAERAAGMFARLDADGDGVLSRDALEARGRGNGGRMARMIERFDADGDGGLSAEEFATLRAEMRDGRGERGRHGHDRNR